MLNRVEIRRLTWLLQNIPLFYLQKLLGCFCCMFWLIVHSYYEAPCNQLAFGWIWADSISLYTSEFIRLLLSSVTSSLNTSNPVPLEAMHTAPPCFTNYVVCFGSWAVPSLLQTFFFPSFCYRLILISNLQKMLFQKWSDFSDVFWQSLIWPWFSESTKLLIWPLLMFLLSLWWICFDFEA